LTTTAGLIAPAVAAAGLNGMQVAALVIAAAAGSVVVSHVNDAGFWLVGRFFGMDVKTTLRTWTVMETLIGVMGFVIAAVDLHARRSGGLASPPRLTEQQRRGGQQKCWAPRRRRTRGFDRLNHRVSWLNPGGRGRRPESGTMPSC
jgi:hypothetical protein